MATTVPQVGKIVHYYWHSLGFTLGPSAAIVTRVYELVDKTEPALLVDLTIFPQAGDYHTQSKEPMVWHESDERRKKSDPNRWWQWPDEGEE